MSIFSNDFTKLIKRSRLDYQQMVKKDFDKQRSKAIEYMEGRTKDYTKEYMNDMAKVEVPVDNNNITKRIIERISLVYSVEPIRNYGEKGEDTPSDKYKEAIKKKNEMMRLMEKKLNLLRMIAIKPTMRDFVFDYEIITRFEPHFDTDPLNPIGISYPIAAFSEVRKNMPEIWAFITAEDYILYNRVTNVELKEEFQTFADLKNPYGILPIVWGFDEKPQTAFLDIDPVNDIIDMNETINVLGTAQSANAIYQSYGYIYIAGMDEQQAKKVEVGPNKITFVGRDGTMGILAPPDTLMSMSETIKTKMRSVALNHHLPHGFIEDDSQPESGIARKIRNQELQGERVSDITRWRNIEDEIYEIEKVIVDIDLKVPIPDTMSVDYSETKEVLTPQEQNDKWEWQLKHNLISEAEILMIGDPDKYKTIEAAQKQIDINKNAGSITPESDKLIEALNKGMEE